MLHWNANKVKNLNGTEIWMFIVARVLIGFGAGAVFAYYYPQIIFEVAIPAVTVGLILFAIAAKGLARRNTN